MAKLDKKERKNKEKELALKEKEKGGGASKPLSAEELSKKCFEIITNDADLRNEILAIGIPVLLPNGASLLRGNTIKIPAFRGENILDVNQKNINNWANEGWVDLRVSNMKKWQSRLTELIEEAETITAINTSSMHVRTKDYWNNFEEISIGKVCSWLFIHEEQGKRMKA